MTMLSPRLCLNTAKLSAEAVSHPLCTQCLASQKSLFSKFTNCIKHSAYTDRYKHTPGLPCLDKLITRHFSLLFSLYQLSPYLHEWKLITNVQVLSSGKGRHFESRTAGCYTCLYI